MSRENRDTSYRRSKKGNQSSLEERWQTSRRHIRKVDYRENVLLSSEEDSEDTLVPSESGFGSVKQEPDLEVEWETRDSQWTPQTLKVRTESVPDHINRATETNRVLVMAREVEKNGMVRMMELMLEMQMKEKERVAQREESERRTEEHRLGREEKKEEEWERRQERLLETLKGAQPAIPQKVSIQKLDLPRMKDGDDPVEFINYIEIALKRSKVPEDDWPEITQTRITLQAGRNISHVLNRKMPHLMTSRMLV